MTSPFLIPSPACISFSGGRSSARMVYEINAAHGGRLPDDIIVLFANTGRERPETLRFVQECGSRWGIRIRIVEYRPESPGFEEVGFNSLSRDGEPFEALIRKKQRLPNWKERWCTQFLKVGAMTAFARSLGWVHGSYLEVIGLRDDEGVRILNGLERAEKDGRRIAYPLAKAKLTKADIMSFWASQPFDLGLEPWEGNCDLCFCVGQANRMARIRRNPSAATWWARQEAEQQGFFDRRVRVHQLVERVRREPDLFADFHDDEFDAECGLHCGFDTGEVA
ncbi:hypothetical protein [Pleomorphomonas koreensis]|uniref:hypothetical protein n=1 Tax=Pleomorphomonas koreensis TaxID=257440 RepID=UPI0003F75167|nr:hypothetical protein [Pleomorphomonas koreensis]